METTGRRLPAESMTVLSRNRAESGTNVSAAGFFSAARSRWKTCGLRAPLPLPNDVRRLRALEKKKKVSDAAARQTAAKSVTQAKSSQACRGSAEKKV